MAQHLYVIAASLFDTPPERAPSNAQITAAFRDAIGAITTPAGVTGLGYPGALPVIAYSEGPPQYIRVARALTADTDDSGAARLAAARVAVALTARLRRLAPGFQAAIPQEVPAEIADAEYNAWVNGSYTVDNAVLGAGASAVAARDDAKGPTAFSTSRTTALGTPGTANPVPDLANALADLPYDASSPPPAAGPSVAAIVVGAAAIGLGGYALYRLSVRPARRR